MNTQTRPLMKNKKVGIWGFGAVGTSAVQFLSNHCKYITVLDTHPLTGQQFAILSESNAKFIHQKTEDDLLVFLDMHDYIVPSPGIDLQPYAQFARKWLPEVDIFKNYATTPTVAITGTVGKTTVATQLDALLNAHGIYSVAVGNIGTPLLSLINWIDPIINEPVEPEVGVVELSSFQLEHNHRYAPQLGILTNVYPNHLDRHTTFAAYLAAKMKLFTYQTAKHKALLPAQLIPTLIEHGYLDTLHAQLNFFSLEKPTAALMQTVATNSIFFYIDNTEVKCQNAQETVTLVDLTEPLKGTQAHNWLICFAGFHLLDKGDIYHTNPCFKSLEHRMEQVTTIHGVTFINDSKSTIAQATVAAAQQINGPTTLLLGGLSKGVDRAPYLAQLPKTVTSIICFGKEHEALAHMCTQLGRSYKTAHTLEEAFLLATQTAQPGDTILLSPGGSSYDLFKNYQERGNCFKKLVEERLLAANQETDTLRNENVTI